MKELTCAFTITLVSFVAATPHGYGVKGGVSAKAEASAVAGGLSGVPLSIPNGAGFSGSFSKSASSSFASSSASSSSSSFSYSGSGSSALPGFGTNNGECASGGCHKSGAGSGSQGLSDFGVNGFQANSGANATATAGAIANSATPGSYKEGVPSCAHGGCSNQPAEILNLNANLSGDEKAGSLESDNAAKSETGDNIPNSKCTSGYCGLPGHHTGSPETDYEPTAQSGAPTNNYVPNSNCDSGKCGSTSQPGAPSTNSEPGHSCASGKCGSTYQPNAPSTYGSNGDCASGKCGTGSHSGAFTPSYDPNNNCATGKCGSFPSETLAPQHSHGGNCASGKCTPTLGPQAPSNEYGHSGAASPSTEFNTCKSGQCEPNTLTGPASPSYDPNDIPVIISGTSTPKPTLPSYKPSYPDISSTTYQNTKSPYNNQGASNFGYNSAFGSGLAPGYNKPALHLTTPKLGSSYNPSNALDTSHIQSAYTPSDEKACTNGQCDFSSPKGPFTSTDSGAKCTTANCGPNTYNSGKPITPGYSTAPGYQVPTGPSNGSPNCASGNCAAYPSVQPTIGFSSVSTGQYKPSYTNNQPSQQTPLGPTGNVGFPSIPSSNLLQSGRPSLNTPAVSDSTTCKTANCASYPALNIDTSINANTQPGILKPSTPDQKLPVYTGGFGGPAGILKPNEYSSASPGTNVPNNPHGQSSHHVPAGGVGVPAHSLGFGTSETISKNPSMPHTGIPSYNIHAASPSTNCKTPNCGSYSVGSTASAGAATQFGIPTTTGSSKPGLLDQKQPAYTGGFGGAAGFLNPNDFSVSTQVPASHLNTKPAISTGTQNSASCSTGNCGSQPPLPHIHASPSNVAQAGAIATAGANAEADAVAYTGGFGGPPGLLTPYDDGKLSSDYLNKRAPNSQYGAHHGLSGGNNKYNAGLQTGAEGKSIAGAQAIALAGASSGAVSGNLHGYGGHPGHDVNDHKGSGRCGGGCGSNTGSYGGGSDNGGQDLSKHGHDSLGGDSRSGAVAKSLAGAVSGSNAFGASGSFASSSATAHASAGAGTKGGYYGR